MARPRRQSTSELPKEPHSISLKVLRLSRPSLAYQFPLPPAEASTIPIKASLSYPFPQSDDQFILSPNLTLPPAFGSAYVGETFSCSLCANNELDPLEKSRAITSVRILAEMQTPSQTVPLELDGDSREAGDSGQNVLDKAESLLKIVRFDLKEEGNHILAVSVSYSETLLNPLHAETGMQTPSSRMRTFRKLYQFMAQPCLSVRTKSSELPPREIADKSLGPYGKSSLLRFALEAQLENVGDDAIFLERTALVPKPPFKATSLNWDLEFPGGPAPDPPMLDPRDVLQVAFLMEQEPGVKDGLDVMQKDLKRDGRTALGQLRIEWRGAMGDQGCLTTGSLLSRKR